MLNLDIFFKNEVKPSLGCTEIGAVAFAACSARAYVDTPIKRVHIRLSANIYKNGKNVGIPGALGLKGNLTAAALGAICGDAEKGLQALSVAKPEHIDAARDLIARGCVTQEVVSDVPVVYVEAEVEGGSHIATAIVSNRHDLITEIRQDGQVVKTGGKDFLSVRHTPYIEELIIQDMASLWELAGKIDKNIEAFLLSGVEMNQKVADMGLKSPWGLGIGYAIKKNVPADDVFWKVKMTAAAAADVRMGGGTLPVMGSGGSGNHGIIAILAPAVVARAWNKSDRELAEAIAFSHLLTGYIKAHTGVLSPICGCSVAAGIGAASAIVRLGGGDPSKAQVAAASLSGSLLGMMCDGAKGNCALKVSTASGEAYVSAMMALSGYGATEDQGIIPISLPKMAKSIETFAKVGMLNVDSTVLQIIKESEKGEG